MQNYFYEGNINCQLCLTHGFYSLDPTARAVRESLIYEVRQLCYYLIKSKEMGFENILLIDRIMSILSSMNFNLAYRREVIEDILNELHGARVDVIEFYTQTCIDKGIDFQLITPNQEDYENKIDIISAIKLGEKQVIMKNTQMTKYKKDLLETITNLSKNAAIKIVKLNDYHLDYNEEKYEIISLINYLNFTQFDEEKLIKKIDKFSSVSYKLNKELLEQHIQKYGEPESVKASMDYTEGKCILASGNNLYDFEQLLIATEGKNINIYTHDRLILAFAHPHFRKFTHLKGHFQNDLNCFQTDFAKFPGPILLTKDYSEKVDNISRGMVYCMDSFIGKGFAQIKNYDFSNIIDYALNAKGFYSNVKKNTIRVGYDFEKIQDKIKEIYEFIKNKEYEKVFIVGVVNHCLYKEDFLNEIFDKIGEKNYIISMIHNKKAKNVYSMDVLFDFSLIYRMIEEFKKYEPDDNLPIAIFVTQCNSYTPSNVLNFRYLGIKDIYLCCCMAQGLNPSIMDCLTNDFRVKKVPLNLDFQISD